jgi:hypothetical protein
MPTSKNFPPIPAEAASVLESEGGRSQAAG